MTQIKDAARIIQNGKVKSAKALVAAVTATCAASTCTNAVIKDGNFCSVPCALTPQAPVVEETPMTDHVSPCPDMMTTCIDAECQARVHIRKHLLTNMSEQDRIKHGDAIIAALHALLADPAYATADPEALAAQAIENGVQNVREGFVPKHVQAPKAVLTTTTKAVRKPRTAKTQPRITDGQEHPVTTLNKDQMEGAITKAVDQHIAARETEIKATPRIAAADKPVEIVAKKGGRTKVKRATAQEREYKGVTLAAIVVNDLTVPALEIGEESIDTLVPPKVRSPYNKARYRLDAKPLVLDPETTTYRVLLAEHERLTGLAAKGKRKVAAKVEPTAKAVKKAKVQALMDVMGISKAEAKALIG